MSPRLLSPLERYFNEATQRILDSQWMAFNRASQWRDVLPCPDVSTLAADLLPNDGFRDLYALILREPKHTEREKQLRWENLAMQFFNDYQQRVRRNLRDVERYLVDELAVWNEQNSKKNLQLPLEKMYREWLTSIEHLSLKEFASSNIGEHTARGFLTPKFEALKERYNIPVRPQTNSMALPASIEPSLREIALFYYYENKVIDDIEQANTIAKDYGHTSGEKLRKHYIRLRYENNRTGVTGNEIAPFCKNLSVIIPYLSSKAKLKAEEEQNTIKEKLETGLDRSGSFA